jgi:O-antigen/teichoic acid export membrane protein
VGVIKRQGIKNTIITYIGILIGAVNVIFIQPKLLSPEELGLTRLLYDFAYLIGLAVPLGLPNIIVKYFPFFKDRDRGNNGFALFMMLVFLAGFVISAGVLLILKPEITAHYMDKAKLFSDYFIFIIPFTFIVSGITVLTSYCQALFKSTVPSFLNDIMLRVGTIIITVLYFNRFISLDTYVYSFIGIYGLELLLIIFYLSLIDTISLRFNGEKFRKHPPAKMIRFGLLLCLASFASIGLRKMDVVFLGTYSLDLVGVYSTAVFIAAFIEVPLGALERISHTKIADNFAKDNLAEVKKTYYDSVKYLLIAGGLLFAGIITVTRHIYELGHLPGVYVQCINVIYIVGFGAFINISTGINSALIFYSNHYVAGTVFLVITLVITILLNIFLIPLYGIYGAATATAIASLIFNFTKFLFIYFKFGFQPYTKQSVFILLIVAVCSLTALIPGIPGKPLLSLLLKGSCVTVVYIASIWKLNLAPEIFEMVKNAMRKLSF